MVICVGGDMVVRDMYTQTYARDNEDEQDEYVRVNRKVLDLAIRAISIAASAIAKRYDAEVEVLSNSEGSVYYLSSVLDGDVIIENGVDGKRIGDFREDIELEYGSEESQLISAITQLLDELWERRVV